MHLTRERLSIRATVFLGFGLILGLWLFAWMQLSFRISEAQDSAAAMNARYVKAQESLARIRTQVLTASVAFRDALLDPDARNMPRYRAQLEHTHAAVDRLIFEYQLVSNGSAEREQFARLRDELAGYRRIMLELLATDRSHWLAEARSLLSQRVTPQRDGVIAISEGIQALNRAGYLRQQMEMSSAYSTIQRQLWRILGLALAIGLAVAILAIIYAGRLEHQLRQQVLRDLELTRDLQDLSAKLVTVQEQERRHIARELHDEIGQALTAIKVELALAERSIETAHGQAAVLQAARNITDSALHQVRDLSYLLHPAALDEFGLLLAVDAHLQNVAKRQRIGTQLTHRGMDVRLAPDIETAAYRIIQEATTNIAKHARATQCRVHLDRGDTLRITVEDDGEGFDPASIRHGDRRGLGLIGMRERASHLHGVVQVDSTPGRGTRITVELPVRRSTDRMTIATPVHASA